MKDKAAQDDSNYYGRYVVTDSLSWPDTFLWGILEYFLVCESLINRSLRLSTQTAGFYKKEVVLDGLFLSGSFWSLEG